MADEPETRFARAGDVHIAYQIVGDGPVDILFIDTWVHHVEAVWDFPDFARFLRRLASFGRLIHFDRRGTGLSDPVPLEGLPDFDEQVEDAIAVLDAAGSERPAVVGTNDGTLVAMLLAATRPERCSALALFAATAKHLPPGELGSIDTVVATITESTEDSGVAWLAPSRLGDDAFDRQLLRFQRNSVRMGAMGHYFRQTLVAEMPDVLPAIRCPTLVLNRRGNRVVSFDQSEDVAGTIPDAKLVELPGEDHLIFSQNVDLVADELEEFLTGARTGRDPDRLLATLLFTDVVDSTTRAAQLRDRAWRDVATATTPWSDGSSSGSAGARSRRRVTVSSPRSGRRRRRCAAPSRPSSPCGRSDWRSARACTRARSRSAETTSAAWRSTSPPASPPRALPARSWSRAP